MKFLILGSTGMAGHTISIYLAEAGHDVTGFSRNNVNYIKNIIGDATNFNNLKEIINEERYDAVINAIGVLNKEAEYNKANAILINSYLPHYLSYISDTLNTKVVHLSTDCVFSGKIGGYSEKSPKDGESFYDRTKGLGELENNKDITFRTSIIGPDIDDNGIGLFNWFMKQEKEITGFNKVIWTGVTTLTLAKAIEKALKENITGLYNLVNNKTISKYDLLKLINKYMRNNKINILKCDAPIINKSLVNNRNDFSFKVPDYEDMISEMRDWIIRHKKIYPNYMI